MKWFWRLFGPPPAWECGYLAAVRNAKVEDCPFPSGDEFVVYQNQWKQGFAVGLASAQLIRQRTLNAQRVEQAKLHYLVESLKPRIIKGRKPPQRPSRPDNPNLVRRPCQC